MATRLSIFIDGSNLYHILKEVHNRYDLDFEAFARLFIPDPRNPKVQRTLNPVNYYNSVIDAGIYPKAYSAQQAFFAKLQKCTNPPFKIFRGKIKHYGRLSYRCRMCDEVIDIPTQKCPECGNLEMLQNSSEKGVDVRIAIDIVTGAINGDYEHALLVSEDSDFVPAIEAIKHKKKQVEIVLFRKRGSELNQCKPYWTHNITATDLVWLKP